MCASLPTLEVRGLTHSHPGASAPILEGIDLTAAAGEMVGVTGPSGGGKTTLLNLIAGLLTPDRGRVRLLGREVTSLSPTERANWRGEAVGYAYQDSRLLPALDVVTNVAWPLLFRDRGRREALREATDLLDRFGLADLADHRPETLSGGEQRRIALARALIAHPPLLLVDEPTANLDPESAAAVLDLLVQAKREFEMLVLLVSHHPEALAHCHRCMALRDSNLVEEGAP